MGQSCGCLSGVGGSVPPPPSFRGAWFKDNSKYEIRGLKLICPNGADETIKFLSETIMEVNGHKGELLNSAGIISWGNGSIWISEKTRAATDPLAEASARALEREKSLAEKVMAQQAMTAERVAAGQAAVEKPTAEQADAEETIVAKAAAEPVVTEEVAADAAAARNVVAEKTAAEKAAAEKAAAEKAAATAAQKADAEKAAAEKAAAEKAAATAAQKADAEKAATLLAQESATAEKPSYNMIDISAGRDMTYMKFVVQESTVDQAADGVYPTDGARVKLQVAWRSLPAGKEEHWPSPSVEGFVADDGGKSREVAFVLGDCERCDAVEQATSGMKRGEVALIRCGAAGQCSPALWTDSELGLAPTEGSDVMDLLVEFTWCEKEKDVMEMEPEERMRYALERKDAATKYFKAERYSAALHKYKLVGDCLSYMDDVKDAPELRAQAQEVLRAVKGNEAACHMKLEKYHEVIATCAEILAKDPENEKALFRRGSALLKQGEYVRAEADLQKIVGQNASNTEARRLLQQCRVESKKEGQAMAGAYKKMMSGYGKAAQKAEATPAAKARAAAAEDGFDRSKFEAKLSELGIDPKRKAR